MLLSEGAVVWWLENNIFPFCCVDHLSLLFQCLCDMFAHLEVIMWLPSQLSTLNDRMVVFMWHRIFIFLIPLELLCSQHHPRYYKSVFPNLTSTECQLLYLFSAQLSPPGCHRKRLTSLSGGSRQVSKDLKKIFELCPMLVISWLGRSCQQHIYLLEFNYWISISPFFSTKRFALSFDSRNKWQTSDDF